MGRLRQEKLTSESGMGMRSEEEVNRAIDRYADMIRRICLLHLKNESDSEDIFQTVFLKYVLHPAAFESEEHEKAWLIRVAVNACKDHLRDFFRSRTVPLEELTGQASELHPEQREVWNAVLALPKKYRDAVYLHYYEGYSAPEISKILGKNSNTVYSLLSRAREMLRQSLGGI
ncbi:MAG: RNA polymerase sigma factor [Candidatus Merdivicinus sp.]